ncbi:MAG: hypothetical protein JNK78_06240 [Planctomycetes bacterium]|nr:hypothetical protein [Planctomycetota bacterium]
MGPLDEQPCWWTRLRSPAVSLLIGLVCYVGAIPFGDWNVDATMMGLDYQEMSLAPFAGRGPHPERFLTPLCAWLLGLSGPRFGLFSHGAMVVFLAMVHHLTFTRSKERVWATFFTYGLSLSALVATYRGLVGYSDPLTFCLLCVCIRWPERAGVFWAMLGLGLLNHGQTLFLWPWLIHERSRSSRLGFRDGLFAAAAVAVYFAARAWLVSDDSATGATRSFSGATLSVSWYLEHLDWGRAVELWIMILPAIVFCFGFFIIVLLWDLIGEHRRQARIGAAWMLLGICGVLVLAIDIFRFVALLGFPMIVAMHRRFVPNARARVALVSAVALTVALRQPNLDAAGYLLRRMTEFALAGEKYPTLFGLVPHCWPAFLAYAAFLAALAVVARFTLPRTDRA